MKYKIKEKKNLKSTSTEYEVNVANLSAAKTYASKKQKDKKTILTIEYHDGELAAYKEKGEWHNVKNKLDRYIE